MDKSAHSYNTLFLNCTGIIPATKNVPFQLQFGEGSTPTWKTASYNWGLLYDLSISSSDGTQAGSSASAIDLNHPTSEDNAAGESADTELWIHNVTSTSLYKTVDGHTGYYNQSETLPLIILSETIRETQTPLRRCVCSSQVVTSPRGSAAFTG
jgi:hypothetical protein